VLAPGVMGDARFGWGLLAGLGCAGGDALSEGAVSSSDVVWFWGRALDLSSFHRCLSGP